MSLECDEIYNLYTESKHQPRWPFGRLEDRDETKAETPEDIFDHVDELAIRNWYVDGYGVVTDRGDESYYAMTRVLTDKSKISITHLSEMIDDNQRQVENAAYLFKKYIIQQQQITSSGEFLAKCDEVYKLFLQKYLDMEPIMSNRRGDHSSNLIDLRIVILGVIRCGVLNAWSCRNHNDGWRLYTHDDCWISLSDFVKRAGIEYPRKSLMQDTGLIDMIRDIEQKSLTDFDF